jgi:hypothetical protein
MKLNVGLPLGLGELKQCHVDKVKPLFMRVERYMYESVDYTICEIFGNYSLFTTGYMYSSVNT